jgi:uncharacterized membrane protein
MGIAAASTGVSSRHCILLVAAAWTGNALYACGASESMLKTWSPAIVAVAMITYMIAYGRRTESGRAIFFFSVAVFLIGWTFETISVLTSFPFGTYHYTDVMGPFIGHVPIAVMPAYCVMGYVSWSMARILAGNPKGELSSRGVMVVPVTAAMLMVMWDLPMDPLRATVEGRWIWHGQGNFLGIPLINFAGWFGVTWTMFQVYALFLRREYVRTARPAETSSRRLHLTVPLMYLAFPVEYLLNPWVADAAGSTVNIHGDPVPLSEVHTAVAMLTATTMLPAALLALACLFREVPATDLARQARLKLFAEKRA